MNVAKYQLPTITCNHSQSASILEILIHTILFNRTLGIRMTPKEIESYLFDDLEYVAINDERIINDVKHDLINLCETREGNILPITLSLYYSIKKYGILGEYDEKIEFERWSILLQYVKEKTFAEENKLEQEIRGAINTILSVQELPLQLPPYEKFSFAITNSTPRQNGLMYDMFASATRMFGTP
jgi:hypothetical protein